MVETVHVLHSAGLIRLIHGEGPRACAWQGIVFNPEDDGAVAVPVEALAELQSHGFGVAPPPPAPAERRLYSPASEPFAPGACNLDAPRQATDRTGHVWEKDVEEVHPDAPAPEALTPPATPLFMPGAGSDMPATAGSAKKRQ